MAARLKKIDGEILISLCEKCKCCCPKDGHCYTCHTSTSIANMCGCGECDGKANSFIELEAMRHKAREDRKKARVKVAA